MSVFRVSSEARPCEAKIIPLRERWMRPCGKPAHHQYGDRWLCAKHKRIHEKNNTPKEWLR